MAATLGSTSDPKQLVPGDVGALTELADTVKHWSEKFDKVGSNLRDVRIEGWHGEASDEFWRKIAGEKSNWYLSADHMSGAATAITSYKGMLSWAQGRAADAIEQWGKGDQEAAEQTLATARSKLQEESRTLSTKLNNLSGGAPDSPTWLSQAAKVAKDLGLGQAGAGQGDYWQHGSNPADQRKRQWGYQDPNAQDPNAAGKTSWSVKIAEVTGGAEVWSKDAKGEVTVGGVKLSGEAGVKVLGAEGTLSAGITDGNLEAKAAGSAYLAKAEAKGSAEYGILGAQGAASASVGANAEVKATVGKDGVHAGAEAFAGAKAEGSASADVGGIGAGVKGEAWAGAGASASMDLGKGPDGKFHIGGELGLGLGLGAKAGFEVTVDPGKVVDTAGDAADKVGDVAESAYDNTLGKVF